VKRLLICAALLTVFFGGNAYAASTHKLKMHEARSEAESAAFDFQLDRDLDSSDVGRCQRKTLKRITCAATASGETSRSNRTCALTIVVRAVNRTYYWDQIAAITSRSCSSETKPLLSYPVALAAIQTEANRFAGQQTTIGYMFRRDDLTFSGRAEWTRPRVPPSQFLPTESCSVSLVATLADTVTVTYDGFSCY